MADPLEQAAEEWLASRGQADLSLYWPTNKPIPQIDYESGQPKPALLDLMAAFARSPAVRRELVEELEAVIERDRTKVCDGVNALKEILRSSSSLVQVVLARTDAIAVRREIEKEVKREIAASIRESLPRRNSVGEFSRFADELERESQ